MPLFNEHLEQWQILEQLKTNDAFCNLAIAIWWIQWLMVVGKRGDML